MAPFKVTPESLYSHDTIIALVCSFALRVQLLTPLQVLFILHLDKMPPLILLCGTQDNPYNFP